MTEEPSSCAVCGEPARLHCAGCDGVFCVEHIERRFTLGYFYFCGECLARQAANTATTRKKRGKPDAP